MARRYSAAAEIEDLEQEGYLGLCEAVRHYDPERGSFLTYASFWIRQGMRRFIENSGSLVRLPSHIRDEVQRYQGAVKDYQKQYGRKPQEAALCWLLGISREKLRRIQKAAEMEQIQSLSEPLRGEGDFSLEDYIPSGEDLERDVAERLDREAVSRELWLVVDSLPDRLPETVRFRYRDGMSLKEIGQCMKLSEAQARKLEQEAIRTLRLPRKSRKLRGYYEEYLAASPVCHVGTKQFNTTWTSAIEKEVLRKL